MQNIQLHAFPDDGDPPWTLGVSVNHVTLIFFNRTRNLDEFCNKTDDVCRSSAVELHKKCMMIEEAVEEILLLVKQTRIDEGGGDGDYLFAGQNK